MTEQLSPETQNQRVKQSSPVEIRIENLTKSFGRHRVLDGINLEINSGLNQAHLVTKIADRGIPSCPILRMAVVSKARSRIPVKVHVDLAELMPGWILEANRFFLALMHQNRTEAEGNRVLC